MKNGVLMYHKDSEQPVRAHPGQVDNMKFYGWTDEAPATFEDDDINTDEVIDNG